MLAQQEDHSTRSPEILDLESMRDLLISIEHDPGLDFFERHKAISAIFRERILRAAKHISDSESGIGQVLTFYQTCEAWCASRRQWGQQSGCLLYIALAHRRNGNKHGGQKSLDFAYKLASEKDDEYLGSILATMSADQLTGALGTDPEKGKHSV